MHKAFEYRLYPNRVQRELLLACLRDSRHLYNEMLEMVKAHYEETGKFLSRYDIGQRFKGRGGEHVPQSTVQMLADRLSKGLKRFFHRKELGEKVGFPRFKSANRWHSIQLRQYGSGRDVYLDPETGKLRVPSKLGSRLKVKQHRPLEGSPRTAHLVYRADGHWYVVIMCDTGEAPEPRGGPAVGIDVGLKSLLTDSEGRTVDNPQYLKQAAKKLRRAQRKLSRRHKDSRRRKKAARATAKQHLRVRRQRRDHAHKTVRHYVDSYAVIAVEDLQVRNMVKNHHIARALLDAGWSQFVTILELKAESAGVRVYKVPPHFTSQLCSSCGEVVEKSWSVRTHMCTHCGYIADRDHNAARNILARAEPSEVNVAGCGERSPRSHLL